MPSFKLKLDLPTPGEVLAGLEPRTLHPSLVRAEQKLASAERELVDLRQEFARLEAELATLPVRVQKGEAPASSITATFTARGATALQVKAAERAIEERRADVGKEKLAARRALEAEVYRRGAVLQKVADEVAPLLDHLRQLDVTLSRALDQMALGGALTWPTDAASSLGHARAVAAAPSVA